MGLWLRAETAQRVGAAVAGSRDSFLRCKRAPKVHVALSVPNVVDGLFANVAHRCPQRAAGPDSAVRSKMEHLPWCEAVHRRRVWWGRWLCRAQSRQSAEGQAVRVGHTSGLDVGQLPLELRSIAGVEDVSLLVDHFRVFVIKHHVLDAVLTGNSEDVREIVNVAL